jgi:hypothetical protein
LVIVFCFLVKQLITLIKGDHPEMNDLCGVKTNSCRICVDGELRTITRSRQNFEQMELFRARRQSSKISALSKKTGQHFMPVATWNLENFDCYTQTPVEW